MPTSVGDALGQVFFSQFGSQLLELGNGILQLIRKGGDTGGPTNGETCLILGTADVNGIALCQSGGTLTVRTGNAGATAAALSAGRIVTFGGATSNTGGFSIGNTTSLTVGAAGAAAALPATPEIYMIVFQGTNQRKLPLYLP